MLTVVVNDRSDIELTKVMDQKQELETNTSPSSPGYESKERKRLQNRVAEKEEICRKLRLVKMYRSKNDLETLEGLIEKWRDACQTAILRLYDRHPEPKPSLADFISSCRLDKDLICFNEEEEAFT